MRRQRLVTGERMQVQLVASAAPAAGWQQRERWVILLLLGPSVLYLLALSVYPTVYSLWLSVHNYTIYRPDMVSFAGLDNFAELLDKEVFAQSFWVTILFSLFSVTLEFGLGLVVAVLLDRKMAGIWLLRTRPAVPVLIPPGGLGRTFRSILAPTYGLLTYLLQSAGITAADWMASTAWALPAVILVDVWQWPHFVTLIMLPGMQS